MARAMRGRVAEGPGRHGAVRDGIISAVEDIRWQQRLSNYRRAVQNLERALTQASYNDLELQGLIKGFELCYELAWKTLQDLLLARGYTDTAGPKPVIRQAFRDGLVNDGEQWMDLLAARNLAAHVYDEDRARDLGVQIRGRYLRIFQDLLQKLEGVARS